MKEEMDTNRRGGAGSGLAWPLEQLCGQKKKVVGSGIQGRTGRGGGRTVVECPREAQLYASASEGFSWSPLYSRGKACAKWPAFLLRRGLSEEAVGRLAAGDGAVSALWRAATGRDLVIRKPRLRTVQETGGILP